MMCIWAGSIFVESVPPGSFEDTDDDQQDQAIDHQRQLQTQDDIHGQKGQAKLGDDPQGDVEHIPTEIFVTDERGIFVLYHFMNWLSATPGPYGPIECF